MLTLGRGITSLVLAAILTGVAVPSSHADAPQCVEFNNFGVCLLWANASSFSGAAPAAGGGSGAAVDSGPVMITVNGVRCIPGALTSPQPDTSEPVWAGHTDGAIYDCIVPNTVGRGPVLAVGFVIPFWAAAAPAAPPDPRLLAEQAVASMGLSAITVGIVPESRPGSVGVVGMPAWMWVANPSASTWGPITRSASAGGFTVSATGRVARVSWSMGDGAVVQCSGPGTPYEDRFGSRSSPTCGHTYTRPGRYTVSAVSHWVITWAGIGQTGTIPMDLTASAPLTIGELQVLTQ